MQDGYPSLAAPSFGSVSWRGQQWAPQLWGPLQGDAGLRAGISTWLCGGRLASGSDRTRKEDKGEFWGKILRVWLCGLSFYFTLGSIVESAKSSSDFLFWCRSGFGSGSSFFCSGSFFDGSFCSRGSFVTGTLSLYVGVADPILKLSYVIIDKCKYFYVKKEDPAKMVRILPYAD